MTLTVIDKHSELKRLARLIFSGVASEKDLASVAANEVLAIKSDTSEPRRQFVTIDKASAPKDGSRTRRFIASSESVDRMGDIIRVKGWDFSTFKKNPQALWCHDSHELPVGLVSEMTKAVKDSPPVLYEAIDFHGADINPFADQVMRMVDAKALRAVSVGFIPLAGGVNNPQNQVERDSLGLGPWGVEFTRVSQLELSVCVIPANADALAVKDVESALAGMVRAKQITAEQASEILKSAQTPAVFALGGIEEPEMKSDAPTESTAELQKTLATVTAALEQMTSTLKTMTDCAAAQFERSSAAMNLALEQGAALSKRLEAIEQKHITSTPATPEPVKQQLAGRDFASVFERAAKKLDTQPVG
jgi:hypothetical protein